jgi:hypothetical protein
VANQNFLCRNSIILRNATVCIASFVWTAYVFFLLSYQFSFLICLCFILVLLSLVIMVMRYEFCGSLISPCSSDWELRLLGDIKPSISMNVSRRFCGTYDLHLESRILGYARKQHEADISTCSSETSVLLHQTTPSCILKYGVPHNSCYESLEPNVVSSILISVACSFVYWWNI